MDPSARTSVNTDVTENVTAESKVMTKLKLNTASPTRISARASIFCFVTRPAGDATARATVTVAHRVGPVNIKIGDFDPKLFTNVFTTITPTITTALNNTIKKEFRVSLNPLNDLFERTLIDEFFKNFILNTGTDALMNAIFTQNLKMTHVALLGPEDFTSPRTLESGSDLGIFNGNDSPVTFVCFNLRHV